MPKPIIPPNDPARLARIQNERLRMIGVDREALDAQVQERRAAEERERARDHQAGAACNYFDAVVVQRAAQADQKRRQQEMEADAFRRQQEAERRQREAQQRQQEAAAAAAEQATNLSSPWLNEAPELQESSLAPGRRVRPDHFKALPPQQVAAIRAMQAQQVVARQTAAQRDAAEQAAYDARVAAEVAEVERCAAAAEAARQRQACELAAVQNVQAVEAQQRQAQLNAYLNSQAPTPAYFAQWGTSHR